MADLGPVPVRPVPIHQIGRNRGHNGGNDRGLELTVDKNGQCQGIEHCVIDDGVDATDNAEFERLVDELLPALGQQADKTHAEHLRAVDGAEPFRPGQVGARSRPGS
jgi:hypothetical protein